MASRASLGRRAFAFACMIMGMGAVVDWAETETETSAILVFQFQFQIENTHSNSKIKKIHTREGNELDPPCRSPVIVLVPAVLERVPGCDK